MYHYRSFKLSETQAADIKLADWLVLRSVNFIFEKKTIHFMVIKNLRKIVCGFFATTVLYGNPWKLVKFFIVVILTLWFGNNLTFNLDIIIQKPSTLKKYYLYIFVSLKKNIYFFKTNKCEICGMSVKSKFPNSINLCKILSTVMA